MLARPRPWIRAGFPRLSRNWTFGTVSRIASHAVLAPEAAIRSCVMTVPGWGGAVAARPGVPRAHPATSGVPDTNRETQHARIVRIVGGWPSSVKPA